MASYNRSHHETGGVILYSGELILLFCDGVSVSDANSMVIGRLYLTTHRMVFTSKSSFAHYRSLSVPFCSITNVKLEQPIFGANLIKATATGADGSPAVTFKLKFLHGGAIEYGEAMDNAARFTRNQAPGAAGMGAFGPTGGFSAPPAYTPSASQYYQAPPTVYQPAYNCGFDLPNQTFDQAPPAGFVYMSDAPPPYPGLGAAGAAPAPGYPAGPTGNGAPGYPPAPNGAVPGAYTPATMGGGPGAPGIYPGVPPTELGFGSAGPGYPSAGPGYPPAGPGYPSQSLPPYPGQDAGPPPPGMNFSQYPSQQPGGGGYPPQAPHHGYPNNEPGYPSQFASAPPLPEKK